MGRLKELIANGDISPEELVNASALLERADLVKKGMEACKKTILFPMGTTEINCYSYSDNAGEYKSWGKCNIDGVFTCYCNWGGDHEIGICNLLDFKDVFLSYDKDEFAADLKRFLSQQIDKVSD